MDCRMTRGIYLRANGEINCYCSTGEGITLDQLPLENEHWDFVEDHYNSKQYSHLRRSISGDRLPFPDQCAKCNYLNPKGTYASELLHTEVEWAHIEPAALCNLRCPYCVHGREDKDAWSRPEPRMLPRSLYTKVLEDLVAHNMNIKWMYFSGRGEPTLHPEIWDMVADAKRMLDTNFLVNTNGNAVFDEKIITSGLDKIKIALDSLDQEDYASYRKGGSVAKLLKLTEQIASYKVKTGRSSPTIIWQKVLFDFNDSPEELEAYQRAALDAGVNEVWFVYTYTAGHTNRRPEDLQRIFPNIKTLHSPERHNFPLEKIKRLQLEAEHGATAASHIDVIQQVLQSLDCDLDNRMDYDDFANMPLSDPRLYKLRESDPEFRALMKLLLAQYKALSAIYSGKNNDEEAQRYVQYANSVETLIAEVK